MINWHMHMTPLDCAQPIVINFELVKFYYYPRIEFYIQKLGGNIEKEIYEISIDDVKPEYIKIAKDFIEKHLMVEKKYRYQGTTLEAVEEIFSLLKVRDEEIELGEKAAKSYEEASPIVIADNDQYSFWSMGADGEGIISTPTISDDINIKTMEARNELRPISKKQL